MSLKPLVSDKAIIDYSYKGSGVNATQQLTFNQDISKEVGDKTTYFSNLLTSSV